MIRPAAIVRGHRSKQQKGPIAERLVAPAYNEQLEGFEPLGPPEQFEKPTGMTAMQQQTIEQENLRRQLFAQDPTHEAISDPHVGLTAVYEHPHLYKYKVLSEDEKAQPALLSFWSENRNELAGQSAITDEATFHRRLQELTHGAFNGMDWTGIFLAGGAVLSCVTAREKGFESSDLDLFVYGCRTEEEGNEKIRQVYEAVRRNSEGKRDHLVRTKRTVTILGDYPYRHVQIILRLYRSPGEVLLGFDLDSCGVGFDGQRVWSTTRFVEAITKSYNLLNSTRFSSTTEIRLQKYAKRGFTVVCPDLDKSRVDPAVFTRRISRSRGLARLLLYECLERKERFLQAKRQQENELSTSSSSVSSSNSEAQSSIDAHQQSLDAESAKQEEFAQMAKMHPSDYDDVHIPWGPNWVVENILKMLNIKDRRQFFKGNHRRPGDTRSRSNQKRHQHLFVTGIDGVLGGHSFWCRLCHKRQDEQRVSGSSAGAYLKGQPLEWVKEGPSYQDYEKGFRRKLLSGSFFPVQAADFNGGVYLDENVAEATRLFKISPVAESLFDCPPALHSLSVSQQTIREKLEAQPFHCGSCGQGFASRNLLYIHARQIQADAEHFDKLLAALPTLRPAQQAASSSKRLPERASAVGIGKGIGRWKVSRFAQAAKALAAETRQKSRNASKQEEGQSSSSSSSSSTSTKLTRKRLPPAIRVPDPNYTFRAQNFAQKLCRIDNYMVKVLSKLEPIAQALLLLSMLICRSMLPEDPEIVDRIRSLILSSHPLFLSAVEVYFIDMDLEELSDTWLCTAQSLQ